MSGTGTASCATPGGTGPAGKPGWNTWGDQVAAGLATLWNGERRGRWRKTGAYTAYYVKKCEVVFLKRLLRVGDRPVPYYVKKCEDDFLERLHIVGDRPVPYYVKKCEVKL